MSDSYSTSLLISLAVGLLFTGAVAGVLAGLLGVGGGIVIVPVLFLLFDFLDIPTAVAMHLAVGTSLATIIPTSISSARSHHAKGAIDLNMLKRWAPFIFFGALVGGIASRFLSSEFLTLVFGSVALLVAINMALPRKVVLAEAVPDGAAAQAAMPAGIGLFSALMGIGGGTLTVPVLSMFSFPVHRAVGTASAFGLVIAVPAAAGFVWSGIGVADRPPASLGYVNLIAAVLIFSTSVLTAPFGSTLAHRLNATALKRVFALFLFLTSIRMLWSVVSG